VGYMCANFGLPRPPSLFSSYSRCTRQTERQTDRQTGVRQTDIRQHYRLMQGVDDLIQLPIGVRVKTERNIITRIMRLRMLVTYVTDVCYDFTMSVYLSAGLLEMLWTNFGEIFWKDDYMLMLIWNTMRIQEFLKEYH